MLAQLNPVLDKLIDLLSRFVGTAEPGIVIFIYVVIAAVVVGFVLARLRSEMRSQTWNTLTPDERRAKILVILQEAYDTAEWLFSNMSPRSLEEKIAVGEQKKTAAITYAKRDLQALGASYADLKTVEMRIENVARENKNGKARYSQKTI